MQLELTKKRNNHLSWLVRMVVQVWWYGTTTIPPYHSQLQGTDYQHFHSNLKVHTILVTLGFVGHDFCGI